MIAFNDHSSGLRHSMPVMTQSTPANDNIIMLSGYTSRLVNTTPTMVMILASHPISLLCFIKKCNLSLPWINNPNIFFGFVYSLSTIINTTTKLARQIIKQHSKTNIVPPDVCPGWVVW
jgi:hypothetical protein